MDKALENFAGSVANNFQTSETTPESIDADLQYFELDVDGDGNDEIFVSRPDWSHDDCWMIYRKIDGSGSEIKNLGIATIHAASIRSGERGGKKGYYESYHYYGDNKDRLIFNAFDEQGNLVALMEETVDSSGKDKKLWDSIYTEDSSAPKINTIPVAPLRARFNKSNDHGDFKAREKKAVLHNGPASDAPTDPRQRSAGKSTGSTDSGDPVSGRSYVWIALIAFALVLLLSWKYRNLIF